VEPVLTGPRGSRAVGTVLVSYGDPLPTEPGAVLAHFLALDELCAAARAAAARSTQCSCTPVCGA
jgi:hypothetical protein